MSLLAAISAGLFRREKTGEGMTVETSLLQNAAWILSSDLVIARASPAYDPHHGFSQGHRAPLMRAYKTSDGRWIQLMLLAPDKPWPQLCALIEAPELADDPRFATGPLRIENGAELCQILAEHLGIQDLGRVGAKLPEVGCALGANPPPSTSWASIPSCRRLGPFSR